MSARPAPSPDEPTARGAVAVRVSRAVVWLCLLVAVLAVAASLTGVLEGGGPGPASVTTVRGDAALLLGEGLYRHDTAFTGAGFRGTDVVNLVLGVPALLVCLALYRRGSLRGALALTGVVAYFLYIYASMSLAAAYNPLFLVYTALLSASFYALVLLLRSIDLDALGESRIARLPRRLPGVFFIVAGLLTAVVWLLPLLEALAGGGAPERMDTYTTAVTYALDLALIVPACFIAARHLLRRAALGYLVASALLGIIVFLGPNFVAQTVSQVWAGVEFTTAEVAGPIGGFGAVAAAAVWVSAAILRRVPGAHPAVAPGPSRGAAEPAHL